MLPNIIKRSYQEALKQQRYISCRLYCPSDYDVSIVFVCSTLKNSLKNGGTCFKHCQNAALVFYEILPLY